MRSIFHRVGTPAAESVESRGVPGPRVLAQDRALGKVLAEAVLQ